MQVEGVEPSLCGLKDRCNSRYTTLAYTYNITPLTTFVKGVISAYSIRSYILSRFYAENELPHPQPPVELGFLKVKPDPSILDLYPMVNPSRY